MFWMRSQSCVRFGAALGGGRFLLALMALVISCADVLALIPVPLNGVTNTFDTLPSSGDWNTFSVPGTSATDTDAQMDGWMKTNGIAGMTGGSNVLLTLAEATASPLGYWRWDLIRLVTQPTRNGGALLITGLEMPAGTNVPVTWRCGG